MKPISNVLIVGLGALGSIYAVKLKEYDPTCVRVLVDAERFQRYQDSGIIFNGQWHNFQYVLAESDQPKADLILVATKADALPNAIALLGHFIHAETVILPLLNGITSEKLIADVYGWDKVLYCYFVGHGSTRIGNAITFDGVGRLVFGEAQNVTWSERVSAVADFFDRVHIPYEVPEDMLFAQWCKFVVNVGVNQVSAVLRAPYGAFHSVEQVREITLDLMNEAVLVAQRMGISRADEILPRSWEIIHSIPAAFKSSMLQDIEAGSKTEVDIFGGAVCQLGAEFGIPTPHNATFVRLIKALEAFGSR